MSEDASDLITRIQSLGEVADTLFKKSGPVPEDQFFDLQFHLRQLVEIKHHEHLLPNDWLVYFRDLESALHSHLQYYRELIGSDRAAEISLHVEAEFTAHAVNEAHFERSLEKDKRNHLKLLFLSLGFILIVALISGAIAFIQWSIFMGDEAYFIDVKQQDWTAVEQRIRMGKSIETRDFRGRTALLVMAEEGDLEAVRHLMDLGAAVDVADFKGYTALHYAVLSENSELIRWLVKEGRDINLPASQGTTPFHLLFLKASSRELVHDIVPFLMEAGADPMVANEDESLLMSAILWARGTYIEESTEILEQLIAAGADVNYQAASGSTPISNAMIKYLPDQPNPEMMAEVDPVLKLLFESGATLKNESAVFSNTEQQQEEPRLRLIPSLGE